MTGVNVIMEEGEEEKEKEEKEEEKDEEEEEGWVLLPSTGRSSTKLALLKQEERQKNNG